MINKFYKINFDVIIDDKTISKEEFETSLHETKQQCLDEAQVQVRENGFSIRI